MHDPNNCDHFWNLLPFWPKKYRCQKCRALGYAKGAKVKAHRCKSCRGVATTNKRLFSNGALIFLCNPCYDRYEDLSDL